MPFSSAYSSSSLRIDSFSSTLLPHNNGHSRGPSSRPVTSDTRRPDAAQSCADARANGPATHWQGRSEGGERSNHKSNVPTPTNISERPPDVVDDRARHPPTDRSASDQLSGSPAHASKSQQPLSVYDLPTATYMWPRFDPVSQVPPAPRPVIYVKYKPGSTSSSGAVRSRSKESTSKSTSSTQSGDVESTVYETQTQHSRKRSSSVETDSSPASPSDRFLKHRRTLSPPRCPLGADPNTIAASLSPADFSLQRTQRNERDLHATFRRLDIESEQSDEDVYETLSRSRALPPLAQSHLRDVPVVPSQRYYSSTRTTIAGLAAEPPSGEEWLKYARPPKASNSSSQYTCVWEVRNVHGQPTPCGYSSKRHLVKRHIESKHLQLRPCICTICGKGFSQKSNLETHLNTHTGEAPHKCPYCDEYFKDPARRHRHMKAVHHHISSRVKKNTQEANRSSDASDGDEGRSMLRFD